MITKYPFLSGYLIIGVILIIDTLVTPIGNYGVFRFLLEEILIEEILGSSGDILWFGGMLLGVTKAWFSVILGTIVLGSLLGLFLKKRAKTTSVS